MRRVLVTGASGLIGKEVCEGLLAKGMYVVGVDKDPSKLENENFKFIRCHITDKDAIQHAMISESVDSLVHLACSVDNDYPSVLSTEEEKESAEVDKFIYKLAVDLKLKDMLMLSTHQVYASQKTREPIREIAAEKPTNIYGKMKLDSEKALQNALKKSSTDIQGVVMRTCPIYTKDYLVNLHSKIYDEKEGCAFIYGYGDYGYSFTCLFNLVDFIAALLNLNSSSNYQGIYNICDSKPIQAKDIVEYERSNHLLGTSGIVMQRNYGADSVKTSVFGLLGNKAAKTDYRYNDLSVACSNISYDNTKAQRISSFRWKLSNTK